MLYPKTLVKKLETMGNLLKQHSRGWTISAEAVYGGKDRLLVSPSKLLQRLSQETNLPNSMCQITTKKQHIHAYCVSHVFNNCNRQTVKNVCIFVYGFNNSFLVILRFKTLHCLQIKHGFI